MLVESYASHSCKTQTSKENQEGGLAFSPRHSSNDTLREEINTLTLILNADKTESELLQQVREKLQSQKFISKEFPENLAIYKTMQLELVNRGAAVP